MIAAVARVFYELVLQARLKAVNKFARPNAQPILRQNLKQLGMNQVNLAKLHVFTQCCCDASSGTRRCG
jgi:hypothetical protein